MTTMTIRKRTIALPLIAAAALFAGPGLAHAGNGSSVAVAAHLHFLGCAGGLSNIEMDVAVTAGSAAPFSLLVSTGGAFASLGTFANWTSHGATKGAVESFQGTVASGVSQIRVIVTLIPDAVFASEESLVAGTYPVGR